MRTYADEVEEALAAVPSEARYGIAVHDVSQLRSALKTEQMEAALTKLEKCRQRACDLIPAADTDYASQTKAGSRFPMMQGETSQRWKMHREMSPGMDMMP